MIFINYRQRKGVPLRLKIIIIALLWVTIGFVYFKNFSNYIYIFLFIR